MTSSEEELSDGPRDRGSELSPADFERTLEQNAGDDLLAALFGDEPIPNGSAARSRTRTPVSLYGSDLEYVRTGLESLRPKLDVQAEADPSRQMISLTINEDLRRVFRFLPREVVPEDSRLHLTADRMLVKKAIKDNRAQEQTWPDVHLLWDLHPVMEWLNFKLIHSRCTTDPSSRSRSSARVTWAHTRTGCPARSGSRPAATRRRMR